MRGLTLTQPWASLVAVGQKHIETRSWRVPYRGLVAIHAGKGLADMTELEYLRLCGSEPFRAALRPHYAQPTDLPRGAIVAVAELEECVSTLSLSGSLFWTTPQGRPYAAGWHEGHEQAFGNYGPNRYGWLLANVRRLATPIPARGTLGLWEVPAELERRILAALGEAPAPQLTQEGLGL